MSLFNVSGVLINSEDISFVMPVDSSAKGQATLRLIDSFKKENLFDIRVEKKNTRSLIVMKNGYGIISSRSVQTIEKYILNGKATAQGNTAVQTANKHSTKKKTSAVERRHNPYK